MDAERLHEMACRSGATVMGSSDDLADLHYLMNAERLLRFLALIAVSHVEPCPVPAPLAAKK